MEIRDVETTVVSPPGSYTSVANWVFVKVTTADGTVGWGECNWPEYREQTLVRAIEELKEEFITGFNPFDVERLHRDLHRSSLFLHVPGPVHAQVVSALEMACWDIVGKSVGEPVHRLLGGTYNEAIRTYTYIHPKWEPPQSPEKAAAAAEEYADRGFTGLKLDPLHPIGGPRDVSLEDLDYAEAVIREIRAAVGNRCDIILGTHGQFYTQTAIRLAKRVEQYDPLWFEEPVPPENVGEMAKVAAETTIPIAAGERIMTPHKFSALLEVDAIQVVQPNLGMLGILGAKKVAGMAEARYTQIAPWMFCGPVAAAANLHLDACSPNFLIQESVEDMSGFHDEILTGSLEWEDGYLCPPTDPGLGVELDEDVLARHLYEKLPFPDERPHYSLQANLEKMNSDEE